MLSVQQMDFREVWPDTCSTVGQAARLGNLVMMKQLISDGRPLDVADNRGWRPLHEAAASLDSLKCLRELLRHRNLDLNWRTHEGESALMLAVRRQPAEMAYRAVKMLLRHGANPDLADSEEETPLLAALRSRHQAAAEVLIACCDVNKRDCGGWSPLHEAVYAGMEAVVTQLLAAGACLSFRDECGLSPLFTAAQHGQLACLRMLVEAAKTQGQAFLINQEAEDGATPLMIAAQTGHTHCVQYLLQNGADPYLHSLDGITAIHLAVQGMNTTCLQLLLSHIDAARFQANPKYSLIHPLVIAVHTERVGCLKLLLDAGFPVDQPTYPHASLAGSQTALTVAASFNNLEAMELLLDHGATVVPQTAELLSPLMTATDSGRAPALDKLLSRGLFVSESLRRKLILIALLKPGVIRHLLKAGICWFKKTNELVRLIQTHPRLTRRSLNILVDFLPASGKLYDLVKYLPAEESEASTSSQLQEKVGVWPSSLKHLCRVWLRTYFYQRYGTQLNQSLAQLQIPQCLVTYLLYEETLP